MIEDLIYKEMADIFYLYLNNIEEKDAKILYKYFVLEMTTYDIAKELDISQSTVHYIKQKHQKKIQKELLKYDQEYWD